MGLDAKMTVKLREPLSPRSLKELEADTDNAFGKWLWGRQNGCSSCLSLWGDLIHVDLAGRYYGPEYERGDLPIYLALRRWFRSRLPGCEVWYGTDDDMQLLDDAAEQELWDHFVRYQHRPYQDAFK